MHQPTIVTQSPLLSSGLYTQFEQKAQSATHPLALSRKITPRSPLPSNIMLPNTMLSIDKNCTKKHNFKCKSHRDYASILYLFGKKAPRNDKTSGKSLDDENTQVCSGA